MLHLRTLIYLLAVLFCGILSSAHAEDGTATTYAPIPGISDIADPNENASVSEKEQSLNAHDTRQTPEGLAVTFKMGDTKQNWNHARWVPYFLDGPQDLSAYDGVTITLSTETPRHDAWVDVAFMEEDGSWYYVRDAVPLSSKTQTRLVHFADARAAEFLFNQAGTASGTNGNFDENFHLNTDKISRIAIGVINPQGVGDVSFTIHDLRLFSTPNKAPAKVKATVTGKILQINDTQSVPEALFGFHHVYGALEPFAPLRLGSMRYCQANMPGTARVEKPRPALDIPYVVSGQYDRKQQMPQFTEAGDYNDSWQQDIEATARNFTKKSEPFQEFVICEFWNEPYLELAKFLEESLRKHTPPEGTNPGDPVVIGGYKLESMIWAPDGQEAKYKYYYKDPVEPAGTNPEKLVPIDPTRFTYWGGRQIALLYTEAYKVFASIVKKETPEVTMIGGFGFHWQEDDWDAWRILHKPLVDGAIDLLDGMCEHHYQGHTDGMPGTYEVLMAYTDVRYNKRLVSYNTETNDLWDAPARGNAAAENQFGGRFKSRRRMIYNLRDLIYVLQETPDKLGARAIHATWGNRKNPRVGIAEAWANTAPRVDVTVQSVSYADTCNALSVNPAQPGSPATEVQVTASKGNTLCIFRVALSTPAKGDIICKLNNARLTLKSNEGNITVQPAIFTTNKLVADDSRPGTYTAETVISADARSEILIAFEIPNDLKTATQILRLFKKSSRRVHINDNEDQAAIKPWKEMGINQGEYYALKLIRNLRGDLVAASTSDPEVWIVSSIDKKTKQLVTAIYNDAAHEREISLHLVAPTGTTFTKGTVNTLLHDETGMVGIDAKEAAFAESTPREIKTTATLGPAGAIVYEVGLEGALPHTPSLLRMQYFAGDPADEDGGILKDLAPGESVTLPLRIPADDLQKASRAWIRMVVENVAAGDGTVALGEKVYDIPKAHTPVNAPYIRMIEIDPKALSGVQALVFSANDASHGNGYRLCMGSIVLESEENRE